MDDTKLIELLKEHEGCERFAYSDSLGYVTIGIGRCLDRRKGKGITPTEAIYLLQNDISDCKYELEKFKWYQIQDDVRKCALIELTFNLGISGLLGFKNMLVSLQQKDYIQAKNDLLESRWSSQVGSRRADNIAYRIEHGCYPT